MHTAITYDQMERSADRTLAVTLWAKNVKNTVLAAFWLFMLRAALRNLVKSLSHNKQLASISDDQAHELMKKLQEIYSNLDYMRQRNAFIECKQRPVFGGLVTGIEESGEDLGDIIEDLALSCNKDFRSMIAECVQNLPSMHSAELVGRM